MRQGGLIIEVDENWRVEIDELNYALANRKVATEGKNKGAVTWETKGYYSSSLGALWALVTLKVVDESTTLSIEGFRERFEYWADKYQRKAFLKKVDDVRDERTNRKAARKETERKRQKENYQKDTSTLSEVAENIGIKKKKRVPKQKAVETRSAPKKKLKKVRKPSRRV